MNNKTITGIERGIGIIQSQLRSLSSKPGVYRMINSAGEVLYVGKANNLKKRVKTYTAPTKISHRITRMVGETNSNLTTGQDIYIVRTNKMGDTLWTKTIGGAGPDVATSIVPFQD